MQLRLYGLVRIVNRKLKTVALMILLLANEADTHHIDEEVLQLQFEVFSLLLFAIFFILSIFSFVRQHLSKVFFAISTTIFRENFYSLSQTFI